MTGLACGGDLWQLLLLPLARGEAHLPRLQVHKQAAGRLRGVKGEAALILEHLVEVTRGLEAAHALPHDIQHCIRDRHAAAAGSLLADDLVAMPKEPDLAISRRAARVVAVIPRLFSGGVPMLPAGRNNNSLEGRDADTAHFIVGCNMKNNITITNVTNNICVVGLRKHWR